MLEAVANPASSLKQRIQAASLWGVVEQVLALQHPRRVSDLLILTDLEVEKRKEAFHDGTQVS